MATRWWRIKVTANGGDAYCRIGEIAMRAVPRGANLCVGGTVLFTTQFSGSGDNSASASFDGNAGTAWAGQMSLTPAIGYQFAAAQDVIEIALTARNDGFGPNGAPQAFTVQSSPDGVVWNDEWSVAGETGWTAGATRTYTRPLVDGVFTVTTGLLFRDDFTRADGALGADWIVESGASVVSGNRLKHTGTRNALNRARLAGVFTPRKDMVVQALVQRDDLRSFLALDVRNDGTNFYYAQVAASDAGSGQANLLQWNRITGAANVNVANGANVAPVAGVAQRLTAAIAGNVQRVWCDGINLLAAADATAGNNVNGVAGFQSFGQPLGLANPIGWIDEWCVYTSTVLTFTGLPLGYKARAGGVTSAAADGVNPLTLDVLGAVMPLALVEILNGAGVVVASTAIGVYGGSTIAVGALSPAAPVLASEIVGVPEATTLRLTGSAFASPNGAQRSARWQVALAIDPAFAAPLVDTGLDLVHLTTIDIPGLAFDTPMIARVMYEDVAHILSAWSNVVAFTIVKPIRWTQTDLGPDAPGSGSVAVRTFLGLGPVAGLPVGNNTGPTFNVVGVYAGVTVTLSQVVVNPAGIVGNPQQTIQRDTGTGLPSANPLIITFDKPISKFEIRMMQLDFFGGKFVAKGAGGVVLGTYFFNFANWQAQGSPDRTTGFVGSLDVGDNLIYSIELYSDPSDWICWQDMYITRLEAGSTVGGWEETDLDADVHAWAGTDAAPNTAWSS